MQLYRKQNGFDPGQLIDVVKQTHEIKEKVLSDKLDKLQKEQESIAHSDSYLRRFMTAAKVLSNPALASAKGEKDAFGARDVSYASSSSSVDAADVLFVSPTFGSNEGSLSIKVDRIATYDKITGSVAQTSKTDNITASETRVYIRGVEVIVPSNATLEEVSKAINANKTDSHVSAYSQKFSETDYRVFLSETNTGEKITFETVVNKLTESFASETDYRVFLSETNTGEKITFETVVNKLTESFASDTEALGLAGTLVIAGEEKTVTAAMSLTDIAALITEVPDYVATVSGVGPYTLDLTKSALPVTLTDEATEKLFDQLGLSESLSAESDLKAQYYVNGNPTVLQSSSNQIEGLYHKASVTLLQPSGGETVTATVEKDPLVVQESIDEFIMAYNELITFADAQTAKDPKNNYEPKEGAYLAKNRQFINMIDRIKRSFTYVTPGVSGLSHLSEVGVRKDENGLLVKDSAKLAQILDSNLGGVEQVFAFVSTNLTGGYYEVSMHPTKLPTEMSGKEVRISVTKNASSEYAARMYLWDGAVESNETALFIGSSNINVGTTGKVNLKGPLGSIYEGFIFDYLGPELGTPVDPDLTTEEQGFSFSQGIGDSLQKALADMVMLQINSDKATDQKNELNMLSYSAKKRYATIEKQQEEQRAKNAREVSKTQRQVESLQADFERLKIAENGLKQVTGSF